MKNLKPQIPRIYLPDNKPLLQKKAVAFFTIKIAASAKELFKELDENLRKIIFSEKDLDANKKFLSSCFSSFIALYIKEGEYFVYYFSEGRVTKFLLTDDFYPSINVKILIRRPL